MQTLPDVSHLLRLETRTSHPRAIGGYDLSRRSIGPHVVSRPGVVLPHNMDVPGYDQMETTEYVLSDWKYRCKSCPLATGAKSWARHCRTNTHRLNCDWLAEENRTAEMREDGRVNEEGPRHKDEMPDQPDMDEIPDAHEDPIWDHIEAIRSLHSDQPVEENPRTLDDDLDDLEAMDEGTKAARTQLPLPGSLRNWQDVLEKELEEIDADDDNIMGPEVPIVRTDKRSNRVNTSPWFPFKGKMATPGL
ncbi:hypothetical protein PGTUg99_018810 [Puccinia graminis f. sp. tritici]|uniref:Uncharacterized protein n=1 Tax=Puccinia graminis f. sp. tritici TaxID=56615 RepID=A0A5B0PIU2_PUCGR|nr:hypothetical protein PGTUg99_018810 [Puccinia graminis f. sp. tritici]